MRLTQELLHSETDVSLRAVAVGNIKVALLNGLAYSVRWKANRPQTDSAWLGVLCFDQPVRG
jgi:hypothetical protein